MVAFFYFIAGISMLFLACILVDEYLFNKVD